jgi:predicted TIM-barrel fold metal-dependent hydrolase
MASTGLYDDGKKGIRRLTDPELRVKDQDRDGVQAEVLYGILGATSRVNDPEAAVEMVRIYNDWLADFVEAKPGRFVGLAAIPNNPIEAAIAEVERVGQARRPARARHRQLRRAEAALGPLLESALGSHRRHQAAAALPHGQRVRSGAHPQDHVRRQRSVARQASGRAGRADAGRARGVRLEHHAVPDEHGEHPHLDDLRGHLRASPHMKLVLGESGIGWIPYVLQRMDSEWEDQFKDLTLKMPPSGYWKRQCYATYQTDPIGVKLIDEMGADNIMWGSDFPHPDGIWPDSQEYLAKELGHLPADVRRKVICENAGKLYGLIK